MRESDRFEGRGVSRAHCKVRSDIAGRRTVSEVANRFNWKSKSRKNRLWEKPVSPASRMNSNLFSIESTVRGLNKKVKYLKALPQITSS